MTSDEPMAPEHPEPAEQTPLAEPDPETLEGLRKALEEQTARAETYLANWQRAQADLANFRKQADRERQEHSAFANAMLISGLLPVLDDFQRAFDTLDASLAGLTWVDGLKLIYRKLQAAMEAQGLTVIKTAGERFDPALHEAVMEVEGEDGVVAGELQRGYKLRDRVLRPAMVKIGNGQKAPPPSAGP